MKSRSMKGRTAFRNVSPREWFIGTLLIVSVVAYASSPLASAGRDSQVEAEPNPEGSLSAYTMGVFLLESGSPERAIPYLESAWEGSGHEYKIGSKLAEAYFRTGDLDRCVATLDELLAAEPDAFDPLYLKARISYVQGDREGAIRQLLRLREAHEPSFEVERMLGRVYDDMGREQEALDAYGRAIELDDAYPYLHFRYGELLRDNDRLSDAKRAFRDALSLEPELWEASLSLADVLIAEGNTAEAEKVLLPVAERDRDNMRILHMLAQLYVDEGRFDDAIKIIEARGDRGTLPGEIAMLLGRLYYEAGDFDESLAVFEEFFDPEHGSPELARWLGEIALKADKTQLSHDYFNKAIELGSDDYRNYLALFFAASPAFSEDGKIIELSYDARAAILSDAADRIRHDDFEANYYIGVSYQSLDSLDTAAYYLERAVEINPEDGRALLNYASVLERSHRYEEAEVPLARLYEQKPDDATICNFYGYLLALLEKDLDKAEELVKTALKHEPENGYYTDSLGWVLYMKGDYERAVIELERASTLVKDDPVILEHLGDAYRSLQHYQKALAAYEKSLGLQGDNTGIADKISDTRKQLSN